MARDPSAAPGPERRGPWPNVLRSRSGGERSAGYDADAPDPRCALFHALLLLASTALADPGASGDVPASATAFTCCDNARVTQIVRRYVDWIEALTADDPRAASHAFALAPMLQPDTSLPAAENAVITGLQARIQQVRNLRREDLLTALPDISRDVVFLALRHEGGSNTYAEAWCPERGSWLQRDLTTPQGPYGRCARWR